LIAQLTLITAETPQVMEGMTVSLFP